MAKTLQLIVSVLIPLGVGALSGVATASSVRNWYPALAKPSFNPPAWVFGPVWTALYVSMGVALFLVWRHGWQRHEVRIAMLLFAAQLLLNGLWSVVFFGMRAPGLALVDIALLWVLIVATVSTFWRIIPLAGALLCRTSPG